MAQEDADMQAWLDAFGQLPEDRRKALAMWFVTQKLTYESLGLDASTWWDHIEWAMHHPLDYSFVADFPETGTTSGAATDTTGRQDETRGAKAFVGSQVAKQAVADGPGMADKGKSGKELDKELFSRFMKERGRKGKRS